MNIGGRVKQRMDELGLTVPDVVARVPNGVVSSQALWALIKRDSIRSEFDVILAKTLGVSPIWLVYATQGCKTPRFSSILRAPTTRPTTRPTCTNYRPIGTLMTPFIKRRKL